MLDTYSLQLDDKVEFMDYYLVKQLLEFMDMSVPYKLTVNQNVADLETRIYEEFVIEFEWDQEESTLTVFEADEIEEEENNQKFEEDTEGSIQLSKEADRIEENHSNEEASEQNLSNSIDEVQGIHDIVVIVNGENVTLSGKEKYIFVDILDFYSFDTSVAGGKSLIQKVNELEATFTTPIHMGDVVELRWQK